MRKHAEQVSGNLRQGRHDQPGMVPEARVELARHLWRRILNPLRLPFRHSGTGGLRAAGLARPRLPVNAPYRRVAAKVSQASRRPDW